MSNNQNKITSKRLRIDNNNIGSILDKFLSHDVVGVNITNENIDSLSLSSSSQSTSSNQLPNATYETLKKQIRQLKKENKILMGKNETLEKKNQYYEKNWMPK